MGEIRFVGTGETRGYPYLVCKKCICRAKFAISGKSGMKDRQRSKEVDRQNVFGDIS